MVIAYEPVGAIGTGRVASSADAQQVCKAIREELASLASPQMADTVRVRYGGSVNAKNIGDVVAQEDIDGALVGGASLDSEQFVAMSAIAAGGRAGELAGLSAAHDTTPTPAMSRPTISVWIVAVHR